MGSPGVGGTVSAASDVSLNNPIQDDLMLRDGGYWKNIPVNSKIAGLVTAAGATRTALDTRYVRMVNGVAPNASGNVTVSGSGGDVPFITPQQFGATGDGSTDDTVAMQAFFDAVFVGLEMFNPANVVGDMSHFSKYGFIPDGVYCITDSIKINNWFVGARVEGASMAGTMILQKTAGKPILEFRRPLSHSFEIGHLRLAYTAQNQTTPGQFAAIYFTSATSASSDNSAGYFNFHIHHIYFVNCWRGISTNLTGSLTNPVTVWGAFIDHCIFGDNNWGSFCNFNNNCPGQPNISIEYCYYTGKITSGNGVARTEPIISISSCDNLVLKNNEGNAVSVATAPELLLQNCVNVTIISCKTESCHSIASTPIWKFYACQVDIHGAGFNGLVLENPTTVDTILVLNEGNLLWNSGKATTIATGFNVGVDVPGGDYQAPRLYATGGDHLLVYGSGSLRNNCKKTNGIPTVKADWFA